MKMANHHSHHHHHQTPTLINSLYLIVTLIWCLYLIPTETNACSCVYSHPQEHFCSSDFVVTLTIQGDPKQLINHKNGQTTSQRYPVKVIKVFKGHEKTSIRKGFIYTGTEQSSCTPTFNKNVTYLMTGRIVNGRPFLTICNFISEWNNLTIRQKKGFRRNFARACGCKVIDTASYPFYAGASNDNDNEGQGSGYNGNRRRSGNCHWETKWNIEFDCQGDYSVCTPVSTIPDKNSVVPPVVESPESNDVTSYFNQNNPYANHLNKYRIRRNRSKLGQKCRWDQNPDYLQCMKRKSALKLEREREGEP